METGARVRVRMRTRARRLSEMYGAPEGRLAPDREKGAVAAPTERT